MRATRPDPELPPTDDEVRRYWQNVRTAMRNAGRNAHIQKIMVARLIKLGAVTRSAKLRRQIRDSIVAIHARAERVAVAPEGSGEPGRKFQVGEGIWFDVCPVPEAQTWRRGVVAERNKLCGRYLVQDIDVPKRLEWVSETRMVARYVGEIAPGQVPEGFVA